LSRGRNASLTSRNDSHNRRPGFGIATLHPCKQVDHDGAATRKKDKQMVTMRQWYLTIVPASTHHSSVSIK